MRLLMVTSCMDAGGAETHIFELSRVLTKMGHTVTVASSGGRMVQWLSREGIDHVSIPLDKKDALSLVQSIRGIERIIKERGIVLVHAHTRQGAYLACKVCERLGVPLVCTVHGMFRQEGLLCRISRWGCRSVAVSHDLRDHLLHSCANISPDSVTVIPNGIDTSRFALKKWEDGGDGGVFRIAFMSRLDRDCSTVAYLLCRIAERICRAFPKVEIVIAGGGEERERIAEAGNAVNKALGKEAVRVLGHVEDTPGFFAESHVFVGVSRGALEAMSCGVPVVLGGDEGFFGILRPCDVNFCAETNFCCRGDGAATAEKLYIALEELLNMTAEERVTIGKELREYVKGNQSAERMGELTERVYRSAVGNRYIRRERKNGRDILLCGYYGYGNLGDERLLSACISRAEREHPELNVRVLTRKGRRDFGRYGVSCVGRKRPVAVTAAVLSADTVVLGGGTLLQNDTSRRSLWYYLYIIGLAELAGKRVELWGSGIGDIHGKFSRRMTGRLLSCCQLVELRDKGSFSRLGAVLTEGGCDFPSVCIRGDLAAVPLSCERTQLCHTLRRLGIDDGERLAAVALRGEESGEMLDKCERWLRTLCRAGVRPVFFVMYPDRDMKVSRRVCRELGGVLAYPLGAADMQGIIRRCEVVCSMRYHALLFAAAVGVPFVGFGDQEKIIELCREGGGRYCSELDAACFGGDVKNTDMNGYRKSKDKRKRKRL